MKKIISIIFIVLLLLIWASLPVLSSCSTVNDIPDNDSGLLLARINGYNLYYYHDTVHKVGVWMRGEVLFVLPDSQYIK